MDFDECEPERVPSRRLVHTFGLVTNLIWGELDGVGSWYFLDSGAQPAVLDSTVADRVESTTLRTTVFYTGEGGS